MEGGWRRAAQAAVSWCKLRLLSPSSFAVPTMCRLLCPRPARRREEALLAAGFRDIFLPIKARENVSALELLPGVCAELDQHTEQVG